MCPCLLFNFRNNSQDANRFRLFQFHKLLTALISICQHALILPTTYQVNHSTGPYLYYRGWLESLYFIVSPSSNEQNWSFNSQCVESSRHFNGNFNGNESLISSRGELLVLTVTESHLIEITKSIWRTRAIAIARHIHIHQTLWCKRQRWLEWINEPNQLIHRNQLLLTSLWISQTRTGSE